MKQTALAFIFFLFYVCILYAQNNKLDSLKNLLKITKEDTGKIKLLNSIGAILVTSGSYDSAFKYAEAEKGLAQKIGLKPGIANAYSIIGITYMNKGNFTEALKNNLSALKISEEINDLQNMAKSYINISSLYSYQGSANYPEALRNCFQALKIAKQIGNKQLSANAYFGMGLIYGLQNNNDSALNNYQEALKIEEETGSKEDLINTYINIGTIYTTQNKYQKAFEKYFQALKIAKEVNYIQGVIAFYANVSDIYVKQKKFDEARKYLTEGLQMTKDIGHKEDQADFYLGLSELANQTGDYKNAYLYHKLFSDVKDSILNESSDKQIVEMKTKYETEKKDKEIEIQTIKIGKQKLTVRYLIAGIALLGIFAWISLYLYNQKKKATFLQQVSETKMKALRAQMNPHFIYNSLNSVYRFMQGNDFKSAGEYLISFSKLIRTILENSLHKEVSLADELKALELFLSLEATRLNNKFVYEINVADDIDKDNTLIPPLLLEPFIENSIWHGFRDKEGMGKITLSISKNEETMICIIEDNGIGRQRSSELKAMMNTEKRESVGMKLTEERIAIINQIINSKAHVVITDLFDDMKQPAGVKVELSLPLLLND